MPRIAVVGVVVDDRIQRPDGSVVRSLGGIGYSVSAMAALAPDDVEVMPVCRVADALHDRLHQEWSAFGCVGDAALVPWAGPPSQVVLDYRKGGCIGGDREERLLHLTPALQSGEIDAVLDADAILLNCVTGAVLTADALARVAASQTPVHLDVHSLVLGRQPDGVRFPERPRNWHRWIDAARTVQCNEQEATVLAGVQQGAGQLSGAADRFARAAVQRAAGPSVVVITRGAAGAKLYKRGTPPVGLGAPAIEVVDPTGAGDTFGAAFVLARAGGADATAAARAAVTAASAACTLSGTAAMASLPAAIASLNRNGAPMASLSAATADDPDDA